MTTANNPTSAASPKSRRGHLMGRAVAAGVAAAALAGCTAQVSGTASPSADLPRGPTPIPASSLASMLAPTTAVGRIVGASNLAVVKSGSEMLPGSRYLNEQSCVGPWSPAAAPAYRGSDYTGVEYRTLNGSGSGIDMQLVTQAVVAFPAATDARAYFEGATEVWRDCASQTVTLRVPGEGEMRWVLGPAKATDTTVSMTQTPPASRGWLCDRAMQVENNIVIEAIACGQRADGEALDLTAAIAKNRPNLP